MYRGCADDTVEENSTNFCLIRMHWLLSARVDSSKTLHWQNPPVLHWRCWLTQVDLHNGRKTVVVVVLYNCYYYYYYYTRLTASFPGQPG